MLVLDAIDVFVTCCWEPRRLWIIVCKENRNCWRGKLYALHRRKFWIISEHNIAVSIGWSGYV